MKNRKWLTVFGLISVLINLIVRNFTLRDFEIQFHDTYITFDGPTTIFILTLIVWAIIAMYLVVKIMADRYKILALIVAIVNPIAGLFMLMLIYGGTQTLIMYREMYPGNNFAVLAIIVGVLVALFFLQAAIEIRALRQIRGGA